ncbi:blood vessel epicardial substance isoform X2 [Planococcus citri]|uniref:blood vessel epicardial substance isoform X2 n=1 Tax=Planococcus citri TaxID=170843 RepID=UPI0031F7E51B
MNDSDSTTVVQQTIATIASLNDNDTSWLNRTVEDIQLQLFTIFGVPKCANFHSFNHTFFQLANVFFLLSCLATYSKCGILYLRCMLLIGCVFFGIWGYEILCTLDALLWNLLFIVANTVHIVVLLFKQWPVRFSNEVEDLYIEVFEPLKVSRKQFKKLLQCLKTIKYLKYQEIYAQEKVTRVEFLSVVLSGKLVISQQGRALHIVFPHQFLDSPEWFGVSTDDFFQVSITAMEESKILLWHRDKLKLSIISDKFLQTVLDHILSRDVVNKLIQVNEAVTASMNGHLPNNYDDDASFCDNKSLMIVKRAGDGSGITALISRQLQVNDINAWRLGKIDEVDFETSV